MSSARPTTGPARPSLFILGAGGSLAESKLQPACRSLAPGPDSVVQADRKPRNRWRDQLMRFRQKPALIGPLDALMQNLLLHIKEDRKQHAIQQYNASGLSHLALHRKFPSISGDFHYNYIYEEMSGRLSTQGGAVAHFYCAAPPSLYKTIIRMLIDHQLLSRRDGDNNTLPRFILEKPFGTDLKIAKDLYSFWSTEVNSRKELDIQQMVLVDHYLYKPLIEQWLNLGSQARAEGLWERSHIRQVQISVIENEEFGKDKETYEELGALGDMIQSHLLKLLCATVANYQDIDASHHQVVNIEGKIDWNAQDSEGANILKKISAIDKNSIVLGQYENAGLDPKCETYVALRINISDNDWKDVPFFLRTGKALSQKSANITIIFNDGSILTYQLQPNPQIALVIEGETGKKLADILKRLTEKFDDFIIKEPSDNYFLFKYREPLDDLPFWSHKTILKELYTPTSVERIVSYEWAQEAWRVVDEIRHVARHIAIYPTGSHGPSNADSLIEWIDVD